MTGGGCGGAAGGGGGWAGAAVPDHAPAPTRYRDVVLELSITSDYATANCAHGIRLTNVR